MSDNTVHGAPQFSITSHQFHELTSYFHPSSFPGMASRYFLYPPTCELIPRTFKENDKFLNIECGDVSIATSFTVFQGFCTLQEKVLLS